MLIVHEEGQSNTSEGNASDLALLDTSRIAAAAIESLGTGERPEEFRAGVVASSLAPGIIEMTVDGENPQDAVARAQALADAFITDHVSRSEAVANAEADAVRERLTEAEQELAEIDTTIASAGPAPGADLVTDRAVTLARISELRDQAGTARIGAPQAAAGTQIVDPPQPVIDSLAESVEFAVVGFVLGFGGGLVLALVTTVVRDRPVLRRDIAEHLGASVIAQLPAPRRGVARLRPRRASSERKRLAAALAHMVREGSAPISVLGLGCPRAAAALAVDLVEELAQEQAVVLVDDLPGRVATRSVAGRNDSITVVEGSENLTRRRSSAPAGERQIGVGSIQPGTSWLELPSLGTETILVVQAGRAAATWLHTVARQLLDLGIPIIGLVLVDPDPRDRTDGTLWDGLHAALRGRAGGAPPPLGVMSAAAVVGSTANGSTANGSTANGSVSFAAPAGDLGPSAYRTHDTVQPVPPPAGGNGRAPTGERHSTGKPSPVRRTDVGRPKPSPSPRPAPANSTEVT
ncbi:polysaccharide biosynthesis protein [Pseudonocardia sp.]|uniref:polysaccharide biosynthesis protein n=1 Tax=Pseudonocardia sp. TaxID=60912 RepID=UPI00262222F4|nr:polysaccharide biosynthesis protein [Pseudonocardia sp.]